MPFTTDQVNAAASYVLDFYIKGESFKQTIQDKPLLKALRAKQKTFPGGKEKISIPVQGAFMDSDSGFFKGYGFSDTVTFQNPNNVLRAKFDWYEIHAGLTVTYTELKQAGIVVSDTMTGEGVKNATGAEEIQLTNLFESKLFDMAEGWSRKFNEMLWRDGTQDSSKQAPGILAYIVDDPTTGTLGGLSRVTYTWWRNRAALGLSASAANQTLTNRIRKEIRQLRRYGGKPDLILCGSAFLEALESEVTSKSTYSDTGVAGKRDLSSPTMFIPGIGEFKYDPTLDDLGTIIGSGDYSKRCYFIDSEALGLHVMDGEDNKTHTPARPHDEFALYRSMTWTGGSAAKRLNSSMVMSIA